VDSKGRASPRLLSSTRHEDRVEIHPSPPDCEDHRVDLKPDHRRDHRPLFELLPSIERYRTNGKTNRHAARVYEIALI